MLAEFGTERCIPVLARLLGEDESPLARHEIAFTMGQLGSKSAVPALLGAVRTDTSAIVRHESAGALGAVADHSARQPLEDALSDPDEDVRMTALVALADLDYARSLAERHGFSL
jgi:deoxyhypusine monooxygenase